MNCHIPVQMLLNPDWHIEVFGVPPISLMQNKQNFAENVVSTYDPIPNSHKLFEKMSFRGLQSAK